MKLRDYNYYGLDRNKAGEILDGEVSYVGDFSIPMVALVLGEPTEIYKPCAVFHAKNPDRSKGHKDYVFFFEHNNQMLITGRNIDEIEEYRFQEGVHCKNCDEVIYSLHRHHFHYCSCGEVFVDGGRDYLRWGGEAAVAIPVLIDLFNRTATVEGAKLE